ncbi:hypothetical protein Taro_049122 [Colocasia esculenta]|uniref:Uncharacterized protein n=1 Tax=Colocasia esculenta TaxID=4460 RepID=A0A843XA59_COLES|nr:hypothetical protein [Colocasia esculenta]
MQMKTSNGGNQNATPRAVAFRTRCPNLSRSQIVNQRVLWARTAGPQSPENRREHLQHTSLATHWPPQPLSHDPNGQYATTKVESHHHPATEEVAQPARCQPYWISGGGTCSRDRRISLDHESSGSLLPKLISESQCGRPETRRRRSQAARIPHLGWIMARRRNYWESLCHRWATGPWRERSQAAKHNPTAHPKKNVHTSGLVSYVTHSQKLHHELERAPTFRRLFDWTHKQTGTDDYVSETARTIIVSQMKRVRTCKPEVQNLK